MIQNITQGHGKSHAGALSGRQPAAIDLLALGSSDTATAKAISTPAKRSRAGALSHPVHRCAESSPG